MMFKNWFWKPVRQPESSLERKYEKYDWSRNIVIELDWTDIFDDETRKLIVDKIINLNCGEMTINSDLNKGSLNIRISLEYGYVETIIKAHFAQKLIIREKENVSD